MPDGLAIDIDGVLTVSWEPIPGAVRAMARVREAGLPFVLVTNTTSRTRERIAATLSAAGFPVRRDDVLNAPSATAAHLRARHPGARCLVLSSGDVRDDLDGVRIAGDGEHPDVVVIGGAGPEFGYPELNRAFRALADGAPLVAMHRNLFWATEDGLSLDSGAFVAGLERAAGVEATVLGKPAPAFFDAALARLGTSAPGTVMVGDDLGADVLGAQRHGMSGVLVRTGKFRPDDERGTGRDAPDHVVDSFADVPGLLGI